MNRFEIFAYIILLNLLSMILLIYTPIHFVFVYFLLLFFTLLLCFLKYGELGKKISTQIKYEHPWIYEKYKNPNVGSTHQGKEMFFFLRPSLIKDKNAFNQLNERQKELFKRQINYLYGTYLSFILINVNLIISSIYFIH